MCRISRFSMLVVLIAGFLLFPRLSSSDEVWTNLGLYGGSVYDIAIDPSNPEKMFAGTYLGDGVFVTFDAGLEWQAVETEEIYVGEDTFKNHAVFAVKIAPSNPEVVWVAHNYWVEKSIDGGQTWTHIFNRDMQRDCQGCGGETDNFRFCRSLAVDPFDPEIVYVGTGGPLGTYPLGAIYKTEDGGETWSKVNQGNDLNYTVTDIAIDPQDSDIVWAVTSSYGVGLWEGTLYRSDDAGETWVNVMTIDSGFSTVAV